jgi:hypothetical protein
VKVGLIALPPSRSGPSRIHRALLIAALRKPKDLSSSISQLPEALATLSAHLEPPDALLAVLDDPNIQPFQFMLYENMFKKVAVRLDERNLQRFLEHPLAGGRVQRDLLDVFLAGSKNRPFRNTWDYLDSTGSSGKGTDVLSPRTDQ